MLRLLKRLEVNIEGIENKVYSILMQTSNNGSINYKRIIRN